MLLNRSIYVLRRCLQRRPLAVSVLNTPECSSYRDKFQYKQTRDFRDFGHTPKKAPFYYFIPYIVCVFLVMANFFDWQQLVILIIIETNKNIKYC